jgi:hypothetical protein
MSHMIEVTNCVVCDGRIRQLKRALVTPFLAERIWNRTPFCVDLVECADCGFMFYNPRLDSSDLARLYNSYRSNEYQRMRHRSEPWYSAKMNSDLASPASYKDRRAALATTLKPHIQDRQISRVLDYGGDRGDLVSGLIEGAQTYVYDISGVSPVAGVLAAADPAACKADLIINSNVLEHVGFPREIVKDILKASSANGLIFLEVPCELPVSVYRIVRRIAQVGLVTFLRPRAARHLFRPAALYAMHEHINYFTEQSLIALVKTAGGRTIASGTYRANGAGGRAEMGWCLARPS